MPARPQFVFDTNAIIFLELAVSGGAECIVSGDQDLLVLHPFRGVSIVTPRGFVDKVWKKSH